MNNMNINWTVRIKNKAFWVAIIPAMLMLIQCVASLLGFTLDLGALNEKLLEVIEAVFLVLGIIGIVNDPTTKTLSDSAQAMTYTEPK
jgi:phi LC3 family holin